MFSGVIVALVTPMLPDKSIDLVGLQVLIEKLIAAKVNGICVLGTTGESATLSMQEKLLLINSVIAMVAGRSKVIVGTGLISTNDTIEFTNQVQALGVDAAMIITPYYVRPTQEGLYQHFKSIAGSVNLPIMLYNVPSRTGCDLLPATVARLCQFNNIVALKDATGDVMRVQATKRLVGDKITLLSGDDASMVDFILAGGCGVVSVVANIVPFAIEQLMTLVKNNEVDAAYALDEKLKPLYQAAFVETNPIAVKWLLSNLGLIHPSVRLPLTELSSAYHNLCLGALDSIKNIGFDDISIKQQVLHYE